ncbi:hypothetical protein M413DRAFT_24692 [Hebeloma cylindrosporum]|uniref:F-box domain-containing protein n=1 Tax=Hebeloma cylindrosporum TaxID=76867 RepID=A0A0C3CMZ8_HEBCY|nr:hypothetical protein M413DRAFT_24692 [Hebeloma cylindrosporum h7]
MLSRLRNDRRTTNNPPSVPGPLDHLLTSNNPPSYVEETLARNTIQALRDSLPALQLEIDNHASHPGSLTLEDRKATIIKDIAAHEAIISPWRKLPSDILRAIFQKTITLTPPWALSQVCRPWRTLIHSTPTLWSCITIDFNTKPTRHPSEENRLKQILQRSANKQSANTDLWIRSQEDRLKLVLQRSANADLHISIRGIMNQGDKRLSLLLILVAHSERWRYLHLELTLDTEAVTALQAVKGHLPRLSQLHLKFWKIKEPTIIELFSIAPRLETVIIDNVFRDVRVAIPVHQLSTYTCKSTPYVGSGLNNSLTAFSNLVHFECYWEHSVDPLAPRITFPRLKVLIIVFSFNVINPAGGFFDQLILPSISEIIVWGQADGVALPMLEMISRSQPCNLRTLSITSITLESTGDLASFLRLTPQLKFLRIPLSPNVDLSHLFTASDSPVLLPKLQSLHIVVSDFSLPSFSSLAPFIATHVEMPSSARFRLKTLQLNFLTEFACRTAYSAIQPLPAVGELDSDILALINSWKKRLVEDIPHLSRQLTPQKMFTNLTQHWHRLDQLFKTIEGYNIPTSGYLHVRDLFSIPNLTANLGADFEGLKITFRYALY